MGKKRPARQSHNIRNEERRSVRRVEVDTDRCDNCGREVDANALTPQPMPNGSIRDVCGFCLGGKTRKNFGFVL